MNFKTKRETAPMAELIPLIREAIKKGKPIEMTVTGHSMRPLLKDRISAVRLAEPGRLKKGSVVLFQRDDGHYVLHRIADIHEDLYDIVGDNQWVPDRDIPKETIIAAVTAYSRDGVHWKENDAPYRVMLPVIKAVRYYGSRIKRKLGRLL